MQIEIFRVFMQDPNADEINLFESPIPTTLVFNPLFFRSSIQMFKKNFNIFCIQAEEKGTNLDQPKLVFVLSII